MLAYKYSEAVKLLQYMCLLLKEEQKVKAKQNTDSCDDKNKQSKHNESQSINSNQNNTGAKQKGIPNQQIMRNKEGV